MGLELMTPRSRVECSPNRASQVPQNSFLIQILCIPRPSKRIHASTVHTPLSSPSHEKLTLEFAYEATGNLPSVLRTWTRKNSSQAISRSPWLWIHVEKPLGYRIRKPSEKSQESRPVWTVELRTHESILSFVSLASKWLWVEDSLEDISVPTEHSQLMPGSEEPWTSDVRLQLELYQQDRQQRQIIKSDNQVDRLQQNPTVWVP